MYLSAPGWLKSGTTWTQEMVWCINNDYNFEAAKSARLKKRVPFLEADTVFEHVKPAEENGTVKEMLPTILLRKSPRIFKSHLPFYALPPSILGNCKVVICLRNPKDVVVSYYYHCQLFKVSLHPLWGHLGGGVEGVMQNKKFHEMYHFKEA